MRFGSVVAVALTVAALCWGAAAPPMTAAQATPAASATDCPPPSDDEVECLARAWIGDSLGAGDPSALDRILAPDVVHHAPDFAITLDAAGVKGFQQGLIDAFPDARYTSDLVVTEAPWAFAHYQAAATHGGEFQGIPPTGTRVVWTGVNVFRVDCGRIVESWSSLDELGRLRQLSAPLAEADASPEVMIPEVTEAATPIACSASGRASVEAAARTLWDKGWNAGDAARGIAAPAERIASFRTAMPDYHLAYGPIAVDGDDAAAYWSASGTDTGGLMGAPTGREAAWDGVTIVRLECGKIADVWSEGDILGLREQLGLAP